MSWALKEATTEAVGTTHDPRKEPELASWHLGLKQRAYI